MAEISPESRIAIAFIRAFRINLDETLRPVESTASLLDRQSNIAIQFLLDNSVAPTESLTKNLKQLLESMNADMLKHIKKTYDDLLSSVITQTLFEVETHLRASFSREELEALAVLADSSAVKKLTGDPKIFDILRNQWFAMHDVMKEDLTDYINSPEKKELIRIAVQEFISQRKTDEMNDTDEDGGSIDPENIF